MLEPVGPEPHPRLEPAVASGHEERSRGRSPVGAVGGEGGGAAIGEGHDAILAALALPYEQAALREPAVCQVQVGRLGTADAGIEEGQEDRPIAAAPHRGGVATGQQPTDLGVRLRIVRVSGEARDAGVETHVVEGVPVRVYGVAKTVVDGFKFRNKIGIDLAVEALRDCLDQRRCTVDALSEYARVCRVSRVMQPYMEALA